MGWFKNDVEKSIEYLKKGIEFKRLGDFNKSIESYILARELDPNNIYCYYNVAKVQFIVKDYTNSILNYLKAAHISILNGKNQIDQGDNGMIFALNNISSMQRSDLEYLLDVPNIDDVLIMMLDISSCSHIGRSVFMDNENNPFKHDNKEIMDNCEQYRNALSGKPSDFFSDNEEKIESIFKQIGTEYLQQNINWAEIDQLNNKVNNIYSKVFKFRDDSQKSVFKKIEIKTDKMEQAIKNDPKYFKNLNEEENKQLAELMFKEGGLTKEENILIEQLIAKWTKD
tara:strand:- start:1298 stop:2149 length:852 start_codon:yes stop_codon:yes gene_type:complete